MRNLLLNNMIKDRISFDDKVHQLREELAAHHHNDSFLKCQTMGDIVLTNIKLVLQKEFIQSIIDVKEYISYWVKSISLLSPIFRLWDRPFMIASLPITDLANTAP